MATNPNRTLNNVIARFDEVNTFYIMDLASQIAAIRDDETADYIAILAALTANMAAVNARIDSAVEKSTGDLSQVYGSAVNEIYNDKRYKRELKANPLSKQAQQRIAEYRQRVERETARVMRRLGKANNVSQSYQQVANKAVLSRSSGLGNYEGIMRPTVRGIGRLGLQVTGDDGKHRNIVSAITMVIQDGVYEIERHTNDVVAKELRFDAVEISVHDNPAPDHEPIQGRVFLRSEFDKLQNHEDCIDVDGRRYPAQVRAIGELNCKHLAYGFSMEPGKRRYTAEQLDQMADANAQGCTIDGKHYTLYEVNQLVARLEAERKRYKRIAIAADAAEDRVLAADCKRKLGKVETGLKMVRRALGSRQNS